MNQIELNEVAQRLFAEHGPKAMAIAAQKATKCEESGEEEQARQWRKIEKVITELRGPAES